MFKSILKRKKIKALWAMLLFLPNLAFADIGGPLYGSCSGITNASHDINNADIMCLANNVLNWLLIIANGIIVIMIIISGVMYVTSAGNPQRAEQAKKTLVGAIVGLIIVASASFLIELVIRLMGVK